jgi:DNA (cytosine-5)-methyltransferase 1
MSYSLLISLEIAFTARARLTSNANVTALNCEPMQPTHLDLFSGIGGFALAAGWAGFRTIGFVEREQSNYETYEHHWPGVPIFGDIRTFGGRGFECDLLTGGFPCQPFSRAGKRRGAEDDRYLWPEMVRVIQVTKPTWIIGENVDGLDGMGLDQCIDDLEAIEYEVAPPLEIPACAVNAPHERNRIWSIAYSDSRQREKRIAQESIRRRQSRAGEVEEVRTDSDADGLRELQSQGSITNIGRRNLHVPQKFDLSESWPDRLGSICGMGDGVSARLVEESKPYGNAIVPQVAYEILKTIRTLMA